MKILVIALALAGCSKLTPADQKVIAADAVSIAACQAEAKACKEDAGDAAATKCWPIYDACMTSHGLKDGGK